MAVVTSRVPAALLALSLLLLPALVRTTAVLAAPIFDFWWTPFLRAMFFGAMVDVLAFLVGLPLLVWTLVRSTPETTDESQPRRWTNDRVVGTACGCAILILAACGTHAVTSPVCWQKSDEGDFYASQGDKERAEECYAEAWQLCIEDGHSPAH